MLLFGANILLATACARVDSSDVRTGGVYADLEVTASGDGTSIVIAGLRVGGPQSNTYLDLVDGDTLTAHGGDQSQEMRKARSLLGRVTYRARFPLEAENSPFRVAFARDAHDPKEKECRGESAPNSFATLPAPFDLDAPRSRRTFSRRSDFIEIIWSSAGFGDRM